MIRVVRLILSALALIAACPAGAEDYRLGAQDRLRVHVYEFPSLDGEYDVGAAGTIAMPLIGEVEAAGATPRELADRINDRLGRATEGSAASSATVQVVGYRPFFIIGDVQNPGPYPYQPGLRMIQALALAGGPYRLEDLGMLRLSRDAIAAEGEIALLAARAFDLLAERDRLEAEASGADEVNFSDEAVASAPGTVVRAGLERQRTLFAVRREAFEKQARTLGELIASLREEVAALERQSELKAAQVETVVKELDSARVLIGKGLTPQTRGLELERLLADVEGDRQEVATQRLRALQALARTEQSLLSLADDRRTQAAAGLSDVDQRLRETRAQIGTQRVLLEEALTAASLAGHDAGTLSLSYVVARFAGDRETRIEVSEADAVQPGDVITVRFRPAAPGDTRELRAADFAPLR
jgi:protein involved in polysaccharide export with SLBB domain